MSDAAPLIKLTSDDATLEGEQLQLYYVPVSQVLLFKDNPKKHNIGDIITSIMDNGFRDPSAYDARLDALIEGNGRAEALKTMQNSKQPAYTLPRGILRHKETGEWCMPILFGVDSKSISAAKRYAIDHNNLTMTGGDFSIFDIQRMWDKEGYLQILSELQQTNDMPITVDSEDLSTLLNIEFNDGDADITESVDLTEGALEDAGDGVVFIVVVRNFNIADDVFEQIEALLGENPGWDSEIVRKESSKK